MSEIKDVLEFIREEDVKFVRLVFCDLFGVQKNIAVVADNLESAFKDGISFDASAVKGFAEIDKSDLFLFPLIQTLSFYPWRPQQGRVVRFFCDIYNANGTPYVSDTRLILKKAVERCRRMGFSCEIGTEFEFYLFNNDENGKPTQTTLDEGGYLDIYPLDKGENIRREICLSLEQMGIEVETSHHEQGPGQNEIDFKYSDALTSADNFNTFKTVVKTIAARNGVFASFMPKPLQGKSGNGVHINISLLKNGKNIFACKDGNLSSIAQSFIAGIMEKIKEITAFLNPTCNSYERFGNFSAPKYISWSHQNRSQLIRIPASTESKARIELRSPDASINPYIAFSLLIHAGLDGIEKKLKLKEPLDINLYEAEIRSLIGVEELPVSLKEALDLSQKSGFIKAILDERIVSKFLKYKYAEYEEFENSEDKIEFYNNKYFNYL